MVNESINTWAKKYKMNIKLQWSLVITICTEQYYSSVTSTGIVSLTYCSKLINEKNWLKQSIPFHYEPLCLYLFSWLTLLIITVWHIGPTVNSRDWVHALLTGGRICNSSADALSANHTAGERARAKCLFHMQMLQCDNKHLTWSMTELSCLFNQRRSLLQLPTLCCPALSGTFLFLQYFIILSFLPYAFSLHSYTSLWILFLTFSPSFTLTSWPVNLPPSLPPFHHSAVFTVIHYHFFRQLALTVLSFVRSHRRGPLGDKEMTEGGLYLPLWPLPCRLLNHVANRQHCLPARPHPDNGEPHSYLIQWSV